MGGKAAHKYIKYDGKLSKVSWIDKTFIRKIVSYWLWLLDKSGSKRSRNNRKYETNGMA